MRLHHKAIAFLSVGFVLLVFGKISKVTLFHAYVKTLEEIEVRNHQGLEKSPALYRTFVAAASSAVSGPDLAPQGVGAWFGNLLLKEVPAVSVPRFSLSFSAVYESVGLFSVIAPRAP